MKLILMYKSRNLVITIFFCLMYTFLELKFLDKLLKRLYFFCLKYLLYIII